MILFLIRKIKNIVWSYSSLNAFIPLYHPLFIQNDFISINSKYHVSDVSVPAARSISELSSLHDGGTTDFRNTFQVVQMKALPPIADLDDLSVRRAAPPTQSRRLRQDRINHSDDELDRR